MSKRLPIAFPVALALLAVGPWALAQSLRTIPDDARRARMSHLDGMMVEVNGYQTTLAPGAQVRGQDNLIIVPSALPRNAIVKYQTNPQGQIQRVWVLTSAEVARPDPKRR